MSAEKLSKFHSPDGPERCGVILSTGDVLELENVHPEPQDSFAILESELLREGVVGTWHTHPRTGPNLTVEDYKAFSEWPQLKHYVVAAQEIWCFQVENGILLKCESTSTTP